MSASRVGKIFPGHRGNGVVGGASMGNTGNWIREGTTGHQIGRKWDTNKKNKIRDGFRPKKPAGVS